MASRSWKMERASVHRRGTSRPRTNKYSRSDSDRTRKPGPGQRSRVWVGGYTRRDGTRVEGHYRVLRSSGGRRSRSARAD